MLHTKNFTLKQTSDTHTAYILKPSKRFNTIKSYRSFLKRIQKAAEIEAQMDFYCAIANLDEELNTPYVNILDKTLSRNAPEDINSVEYTSRLIFAWAVDYDFGENWPKEGVYDKTNNCMLHLEDPKQLWDYIKFVSHLNFLYPQW